MTRLVTATVSRDAIRHNIRTLRTAIGPERGVCAVVKADAYGHGLADLWQVFAEGCDMLAVATADEALTLRDHGYRGPLLVLFGVQAWGGEAARDVLRELMARDVTLTLGAPEDVRIAGEVACGGASASVHVEVDSGMHRAGVAHEDAPDVIAQIRNMPALRMTGLFSHFAMAADPDPGPTQDQIRNFTRVLDAVKPEPGVVRHMANSSGSMLFPECRFDMVRTGLILYGWRPEPHVGADLDFRPALRVTSHVMQVRHAPEGDGVGYGLSHRLTRPTRMGLVAGGYGDGYMRCFSNQAQVGVGGRYVPVLGRVSMDQFSIDLTDVPDVDVGSEVELVAPDANAPNGVVTLARLAQTIPYEILTGLISPRIAREYTGE